MDALFPDLDPISYYNTKSRVHYVDQIEFLTFL